MSMTDAGPAMMDDAGFDSATPPTGDGNDSFDQADVLDISGDPATMMARIGTPGDRDFYTFEGTTGQWMFISTDANPDAEDDMIDTVITLYDASMTMIAENDDGQPRTSTDSEIITRLPADGTYYVMVQEFSQWADEAPFEGQADYDYEVSVARLNISATAVTVDAEAGDDAASAQALGFNVDTNDFGILVGDFRDDSDIDVFSFTVPAGKERIRAMMMPSGAMGYGSTTAVSRMWVTNSDGTEIVARINITESSDPAASAVNIRPNLPAGDYNFVVENGGAPGSNGFYVMKLWRYSTENDPETDDAANNDPTMAQEIAFSPNPRLTDARSGFVLSRLDPTDVDHFSIDVMDTEEVSVFCGSRTGGSGVVDLNVALVDPAAAADAPPLATSTESATEGAAIEDFAVAAPGTYLVRLTMGSQDAEVSGNWIRCGVTLQPPTP